MDTDNSVVRARGRGEWGMGGGEAKRGKWETSAIMSTIKNIFLKIPSRQRETETTRNTEIKTTKGMVKSFPFKS